MLSNHECVGTFGLHVVSRALIMPDPNASGGGRGVEEVDYDNNIDEIEHQCREQRLDRVRRRKVTNWVQ